MIGTALVLSHGIYKSAASSLGNIVLFGCIVSACILIAELIWYRIKSHKGEDFQ